MDEADPKIKSNQENVKTAATFFKNVNLNNLIAGTVAGASATVIFHPLELIKIRWQVYESISLKNLLIRKVGNDVIAANLPNRPKYRSMLDTFKTVYNSENGFRGLYRGLVINSTASGTAWGFYFLIYNSLKSRHANKNANELTFLEYTVDATLAGISTIIVTNPLFLIKTRMCLQYSNVSNDSSKLKYKNSWEALKVLIRQDGFFGLYKGILPGLFGTLNGTIQMVTYDLMKKWWLNHLKRKQALSSPVQGSTIEQPIKLDTYHFSIFSSLSKILAVVCTYPFQLVRARLQDQHQSYKNLTEVVVKTYRNERLYGFYKGLMPCLIRVTPAASVTFIIYENLLEFLDKKIS